jgi:hypothetical protein
MRACTLIGSVALAWSCATTVIAQTNWTDRTVRFGPETRWEHAMTYDAARQRGVMFGGWSGQGYRLGDTWTWDGTTWTRRSPGPGARSGAAMAYDAARGRVVMTGFPGAGVFDTWEWDGANWLRRIPATTSPPNRYLHAMAYDAARQRVVMFGGASGGGSSRSDTWEWDGNDWVQAAPGPARQRHRLAYDAVRGRVVMFGGRDANVRDRKSVV